MQTSKWENRMGSVCIRDVEMGESAAERSMSRESVDWTRTTLARGHGKDACTFSSNTATLSADCNLEIR